MCRDIDLFGEVVVTLDDVEKWLLCVPRFDDVTRQSQIEQYINGWEVVNKIKRAKLDNSFYSLKPLSNDNKSSLSIKLKFHFKPKLCHVKTARLADFKRIEKVIILGKERKRRVKKVAIVNDAPNPYLLKSA